MKRTYKPLTLITLVFLLLSCANNPEAKKNPFSIKITNAQKKYETKNELQLSIGNKKRKIIDSVVYYVDANRISSELSGTNSSISLQNQKLGIRTVTAAIYSEGNPYNTTIDFVIVSSIVPKLYSYKILETYPHDIKAYTQGLEFINDTLYESTGQYGYSSLRKTNYKTGEVYKQIDLEKKCFGEGLTILNKKIYQLTWRENIGYIYDLATFKQTGTFVYGASREGWGLCNNGSTIFKSDGTEKIWTLNSKTLTEEKFVEIYTNRSKIKSVNELEWVNGKIYANIYEKGSIAIINPDNGAVEGVINLTALKDKVTQHDNLNVMNGIAYNGEENVIYVTGKNWDKLFKIEIISK
jgi:glutamine cyclotransferase